MKAAKLKTTPHNNWGGVNGSSTTIALTTLVAVLVGIWWWVFRRPAETTTSQREVAVGSLETPRGRVGSSERPQVTGNRNKRKQKKPKCNWMQTQLDREENSNLREEKSYLYVATDDELPDLAGGLSMDSSKSMTETPKDQPIKPGSWDDLFISPGRGTTKLRPFAEAAKAMKEDEIEEQSFFKEGGYRARRCVYFLYGKNYKGDKPKETRIAAIEEMLAHQTYYDRLKDVALSDPVDHVACPAGQPDCALAFLNMALVVEHFFREGDQTKFGEYPGTPMARFQKGSNCYMPAVCVWYSLMMRQKVYLIEGVQNPDKDYMVDIAQQTRRHVLKDDKHLELRVLGDKGHPTPVFADAVVGEEPKTLSPEVFCSNWSLSDFGEYEHAACDSFIDCKRFGVGLVYNFAVYDGMKKTKNAAISRLKAGGDQALGYYKFDGDQKDTEGKFVPFEMNTQASALMKELRELLQAQQEEAKDRQKERRMKLSKVLFPRKASQPKATVAAVKNDTTEPLEARTGRHAMVMLGGEIEQKDGETKYYFMLLNWWKCMPVLLLSADYMKTCGAIVRFRKRPPRTDLSMAASRCLVSECEGQDYCEETGDYIINDILNDEDFGFVHEYDENPVYEEDE